MSFLHEMDTIQWVPQEYSICHIQRPMNPRLTLQIALQEISFLLNLNLLPSFAKPEYFTHKNECSIGYDIGVFTALVSHQYWLQLYERPCSLYLEKLQPAEIQEKMNYMTTYCPFYVMFLLNYVKNKVHVIPSNNNRSSGCLFQLSSKSFWQPIPTLQTQIQCIMQAGDYISSRVLGDYITVEWTRKIVQGAKHPLT